MKVLQINAVNQISSTGRTVLEMSEFLRAHGHQSIAAVSLQSGADGEYVINRGIDTKIHALLSRITGRQAYFSKGATKRLTDYIQAEKPDVAVLGNLHANYINLPLLLKYLAKNDIPTVAVLHDCWFYTGKCCHYTVTACDRWKTGCGNCPSLKKYNTSWFFDRTRKMISDKEKLFCAIPRLAVIGVSDWITSEAKKSPVFKTAKITERIYNWIDTDTFRPMKSDIIRQKLNISDKKVILSVASEWSAEKGLDTIIEISKRLNDGERLVLVGNIRQKPTDFGEKVICIGQTHDKNELAEYYSMADVFFQPSLEESFGKVTAEALACGTPVVCFDSTANPELVKSGCGAVVKPHDFSGCIEKLREIMDKDGCSDTCRQFALREFGMEENLGKYLSVFERISI